MQLITQMPSKDLQSMLAECSDLYNRTAAKIIACFQKALKEGYSMTQARMLIEQSCGMSARQVRKYLPPELKDMRYNRGSPLTGYEDYKMRRQTAAPGAAKAEETNLDLLHNTGQVSDPDYVNLGGADDRITVEPAWCNTIFSSIKRGQAFSIVRRAGKIIAIEGLVTA